MPIIMIITAIRMTAAGISIRVLQQIVFAACAAAGHTDKTAAAICFIIVFLIKKAV